MGSSKKEEEWREGPASIDNSIEINGVIFTYNTREKVAVEADITYEPIDNPFSDVLGEDVMSIKCYDEVTEKKEKPKASKTGTDRG